MASTSFADRLLVARGFAPPQRVIPLPVSLEPKAGSRRLFGMPMLPVRRDDLRDEVRAVARLAEQQRAAVRERLDLAMVAALDVARWLPGPVYRWLGDQAFDGELTSLILSNPGEVSIERFVGLPVIEAYPLPTVMTPPGFQVIFCRFGGRLSASIVHGAGLLRPDGSAALADALLGEAHAPAARPL